MKDTMTVIELLNKIANGEEIPKEIIYDNWYWHLSFGGYYNYIINDELTNYIFKSCYKDCKEYLNSEIKVSNNSKTNKLKDIDEVSMLDIDVVQGQGMEYIQINHDLITLKNSLNNCIRRVNLLTKEIRSDRNERTK